MFPVPSEYEATCVGRSLRDVLSVMVLESRKGFVIHKRDDALDEGRSHV